ncbi:fimbrial protein [Pantoea dispersa]|uniref:fimbrial protein n=1 Tax=Pantoea dispersa TaxID=59814 RepID=UPI0009C19D6C|nr:fimbrial protein [Pantoea dispersa]
MFSVRYFFYNIAYMGLIVFFISLASFHMKHAYAKNENACWGEPVNLISVSASLIGSFPSNLKGAKRTIGYESVPREFPAYCNRSYTGWIINMAHYGDLDASLTPSLINTGYYKLSEDIDIKIRAITDGEQTVDFPFLPGRSPKGGLFPEKTGERMFLEGFSVAGSGKIDLILRRDIIGGAVIIPAGTPLFTIYRVLSISPYPEKPDNPILRGVISGGGIIVPVPVDCKINQDNPINVEFGNVTISNVSQSDSGGEYTKSVFLDVSCNSNITKEVLVTLVSQVATFSENLIMTNNENLGIAFRHQGKTIKPYESFSLHLYEGKGQFEFDIFPVKNKTADLMAGQFNATAVLIVTAI